MSGPDSAFGRIDPDKPSPAGSSEAGTPTPGGSGGMAMAMNNRGASTRQLPELRCYPHTDQQFVADTERAVRETHEQATRSTQLIEEVRRKLQFQYPAVRIDARHSLADEGEHRSVWYCYRDGSLMP